MRPKKVARPGRPSTMAVTSALPTNGPKTNSSHASDGYRTDMA